MEPYELRRSRRDDRRARKATVEVQTLESRQLLAWTPLGFSLPDLTVSGYAGPIAAYEQPIALTVTVQNLGASSILEPLSLQPGAVSTADAPPTTVGVFLSRSPRFGPGAIRIGDIAVPAVPQNSFVEVTDTVTMPTRLPGLPGSGGTVYLYLRADADRTIQEIDRTNNTTRQGIPVQIAAALPELVGVALDVPTVMQPGDTIAPSIKIANYGTVNPNTQGPFDVALVASTDPSFGPGDVVLATYTVFSLPPLSLVPMQRVALGDVNIVEPINMLTIDTIDPITLPTTPGEYFIGVVVDPTNQIREISEIGRGPDPRLFPIRPVGPRIHGLPTAGEVTMPTVPQNIFPFVPNQPDGRLPTVWSPIVEPPIIIIPVEGGGPIVVPQAAATTALAGPRAVRADLAGMLAQRQSLIQAARRGGSGVGIR